MDQNIICHSVVSISPNNNLTALLISPLITYSLSLFAAHDMEHKMAMQTRAVARNNIGWYIAYLLIMIFAYLELDDIVVWSWWLVFTPFWVIGGLICCCSCCGVMSANMEMSDLESDGAVERNKARAIARVQQKARKEEKEKNYGATGKANTAADADIESGLVKDADDEAPIEDDEPEYTPEEKEEKKQQYAENTQRSIASCCGSFFAIMFCLLFVGRFAGGDNYSSIWIIFPFLLICGIVVCCFGVCIFGFSEQAMEEGMQQQNAAAGGGEAPFSDANGYTNFNEAKTDAVTEPAEFVCPKSLSNPAAERARIEQLSIKNIKLELKARGVDITGFSEKKELIDALCTAPTVEEGARLQKSKEEEERVAAEERIRKIEEDKKRREAIAAAGKEEEVHIDMGDLD